MTSRDFHLPGRSPVYAANSLCATSHPLATEAAISVLRRGGNAIDAAVTASAVLAVVEPAMTGIGGDCFAIIARKDKPLVGLNGSGRAPAAAKTAFFLDKGMTEIGEESVHSVTVPGAIDAWDRLLKEHGTIGLDAALQPAIKLAEEGFAVAPRVAADWRDTQDALRRHDGTRQHYLNSAGNAPVAGDFHRLPALARTLKAIAAKGRDAFYTGEIAETMVQHLRSLGGLHTLDDFAACKGDWVTPVLSSYRGHELAELPPNTHGITAQVILNILENFDLGALAPGSAEHLHLEMEAARIAYRLRDETIADIDHMTVTVADLLSKSLARDLSRRIDPERRMADIGPMIIPHASDTIYLTIVDKDWTAISFINSVYHSFGSHICDPETGVLFQNRGACFNVKPDHPNCIAPAKRPLHTIIPAMAMKDGRVEMAYGVMGGAYQPAGHAHVLMNVVDFGMDIQAAIDAPRIFFEPQRLGAERGVPQATLDRLTAMGHDVFTPAKPWGGGQGVQLDWQRGVLIGGSDPRKDGCALGF